MKNVGQLPDWALKKKKKVKTNKKVFFHSDCFCKHIFIYFIMFYSQALEMF